jgi:hypothetical protein
MLEYQEGPQVVTVPRVGPVRIIRAPLPEEVKGVTLKGIPEAPILVTKEDIPEVKLERIVGHELGHRLRDQILKRAIVDDPSLFLRAPNADAALARYLVNQGLEPRKLDIKHSEARPFVDKIFREEFISDQHIDSKVIPGQLIATEFNAEVFGCWAANTCSVPDKINNLFTQAAATQELAAFKVEAEPSLATLALIGAAAFILWRVIK